MKIIIAGDGKVGATLTRQFTAEDHDVTIIDSDPGILDSTMERYDLISVQGNCASMTVLNQAGVKEADLLVAVTNHDEINLLCCTTAHSMNPKLHTIARIRNPEYNEQAYKMRDVFGLSLVINPENQAATEIHRLLKYPGFLRRDTFAKGRTEIVELRVDAGSKLRNVKLMDLKSIVKCQVLVCAVLRNGSAIAPGGDFILREGDRIFVTALSENLTTLLNNLGIITRRVRRVLICGGGMVGYYLAARLEKEGVHVKIVESSLPRCQELSSLLPDTDIIHGDVSDQDLLISEGMAQYDALVTCTGRDELNMIVSLYAASCGVPQVITRLSNADNRSLIDSLGLGSVVCPKDLCSNNIARYVRAMKNQTGAALSVHAIADGQAEAMEFRVDETTRHCGEPLKQIKLKPNVLLVSINHGEVPEIANGDSTFRQGDIVIVVTNGGEVLYQLNDIFA
ncbi:MAG: Trk system potassium transporter TrkA [Clostridiales bacterium]|nr:Trk system potassium transporter TrkA [Clostridiales bacterium]MCI6433187.1 Trk system potassium transporter TrkA [Clostridiales bacterium]